jgi:glycosyltransferase involved in cell wall biosynthesis
MLQLVKGHYDLVYGNNFGKRCERALWAAKLIGRPFIWHIREPITEKFSSVRSLRFAQALIANSEDTASRVRRLVPNKEIVTVPNGVELDRFSISRESARRFVCRELTVPEDSVVIINIGRLSEFKNQLHTIEAAAGMIRKYPQIHVLLVGHFPEPDYKSLLEERATQMGISNHVHMVGFQQDVTGYLRGSDLLLHTPVKESQGRVILEAMAAKIPVVAYDVGGIGESVLHGRTGFLVPFGDISGLVNSIETLIKNPEIKCSMGERGHRRVSEAFTGESTAGQVKAVIESVLDQAS